MSELILMLDDLGAEAYNLLINSSFRISSNISELSNASALIVRSTKVTSDMIDQAPKLRIISRAGVGMDSIDVEYAREKSIITVNAQGGNSVNAAETTMGLILSLAHKISFSHHLLFGQKIWERGALTEGFELSGKVLGIIGCGHVGSKVAHFAHAFNMKVLVYDPYIIRVPEFATHVDHLETLLSDSDIITLHVPLTQETYHMIDAPQFNLIKSTSYLVNACRGSVVREDVLIEALCGHHIAGAALDVFEEEPLPWNSRLYQCPNLVMIPHLGGAGKECRERVSVMAVQQVLDYLKNRKI